MVAIVKAGTAYEGNTLTGALLAMNLFTFDVGKGQLLMDGKLDTISYSNNYNPTEMINEMSKRAKTLLERRGWRVYRSA